MQRRFLLTLTALSITVVAPAHAGYYFTDAGGQISTSDGVHNIYQRNLHTYGADSSYSNTQGYFNSYTSVASSSNLTTGELKSQASIQALDRLDYGIAAVSFANYGDSFKFAIGGHLPDGTNVLGDRTVQFNLDVSGLISMLNTDNFVHQNFSNITLMIVKSGYLGNAAIDYLPYEASYNVAKFQWGIGADANDGNQLTSFPTHLTASFNPGGDFDWWLSLRMVTVMDNISGPASVDFDFSHTLKTSFIAPDDLSVYSSGGFLGTGQLAAVPEPSTYALAGSAIAALLVLRRKK